MIDILNIFISILAVEFLRRYRSRKPTFDVIILDERLKLPKYAKEGDAAFDLRASISNPTFLLPGETITLRTGLKIWIKNPKYVGVILPRSGLGVEWLNVANTAGVIDSGYQGEINLVIFNRSNKIIKINPLDRLCQMLILRVEQVELHPVHYFNENSARGVSGFGSSGLS